MGFPAETRLVGMSMWSFQNGGWSLKGVFFRLFFSQEGNLEPPLALLQSPVLRPAATRVVSMVFPTDVGGCGWKVKESAGMLECGRFLENTWHVYNSYQVCWFEWVCVGPNVFSRWSLGRWSKFPHLLFSGCFNHQRKRKPSPPAVWIYWIRGSFMVEFPDRFGNGASSLVDPFTWAIVFVIDAEMHGGKGARHIWSFCLRRLGILYVTLVRAKSGDIRGSYFWQLIHVYCTYYTVHMYICRLFFEDRVYI